MTAVALLISLLAVAAPALIAQPDWRPLDPQDALVIDTTEGRIVVEMRPDLAPKAVERIKMLSREHVYDGLQFHRVIDHFVDQTGNPNNHDGGASNHPNLDPEFDARLTPPALVPVARPAGAVLGFLGSTPVEASTRIGEDGKSRTWGLYCSGVAGMGRQAAEGTANSEIFFMRDPARRLDHDYTVWGRAVIGLDVVRKIKIGFPPKDPDKMLQVRVLADLPLAEQPVIEIMNERGAAFATRIENMRKNRGADFSPCDLDTPARIVKMSKAE